MIRTDTKSDCELLDELYSDRIKYKQLQSNWNELKKYIEDKKSKIGHHSCALKAYVNKMSPYNEILNKMQELEGNNVNTSN